MSTERVVLVGIIWAVLLLGLLILREFLRAIRTESRRRVLPVLDRLVLVMIVAFAGAAGLRLIGLISPTTNASPGASSATDVAAVSPTVTPAPSPVVPTAATTQPPTPGSTPTAPPTATASPTVAPTATQGPTPTLAPASPTASPTLAPTQVPTAPPTKAPTPKPTTAPTASPTLPPTAPPTVAPTPVSTPVATPTEPSGGTVTVPATFRAYIVKNDSVRSFHNVEASQRFTARSTAPQDYGFPTFSQPDGTVQLVQLLSGPYAGTWVSPDDPGVRYSGN